MSSVAATWRPTPGLKFSASPICPLTPDHAVFCDHCQLFIRSSYLDLHHCFHRALKVFEISDATSPPTLKVLVKKRAVLLKGKKVSFPKINMINKQFELLLRWTRGLSATPLILSSEYQVTPTKVLNTVSPCPAVAFLSEVNSNYRRVLEHRTICASNWCDNMELYAGLFAGYEGESSSNHCYSKMHSKLSSILETIDHKLFQPSSEELEYMKAVGNDFVVDGIQRIKGGRASMFQKVFRQAYFEMDSELLYNETETNQVRWSGSSAMVAVVNVDSDEGTSLLHMAWAGDDMAVACVNGSPVRLSWPHNLRNPREVDRLPGFVHKGPTRGLGNHGAPLLRKHVTCVPSVRSYRLDPSRVQFVLLASASVWEFISIKEAVEIVLSLSPCKFLEFYKGMSSDQQEELEVSQGIDEENARNQYPDKAVHFDLQTRSKSESSDSVSSLVESSDEEIPIVIANNPADTSQPVFGSSLSEMKESYKEMAASLSNIDVSSTQDALGSLAANMVDRLLLTAIKKGARDNLSAILLTFDSFSNLLQS